MAKTATDPEPKRVILATRLKDARVFLGLTQLQVAEVADSSQSAVSAWERDETKPTTGQLRRLAEFLCIPPLELVDLAADYEERLKNGHTNKRADDRKNHHAKRP